MNLLRHELYFCHVRLEKGSEVLETHFHRFLRSLDGFTPIIQGELRAFQILDVWMCGESAGHSKG